MYKKKSLCTISGIASGAVLDISNSLFGLNVWAILNDRTYNCTDIYSRAKCLEYKIDVGVNILHERGNGIGRRKFRAPPR